MTSAERKRIAQRLVQMLASNPGAKALMRQTLDLAGLHLTRLGGVVLGDDELENNEVAGLQFRLTEPGKDDVVLCLIIEDQS